MFGEGFSDLEVKFGELERFVDVFVGSVEWGGEAVEVFADAGHHDQADVVVLFVFTDVFGDFPSRESGHTDIEEDQVGLLADDHGESGVSVGGFEEFAVHLTEVSHDHLS